MIIFQLSLVGFIGFVLHSPGSFGGAKRHRGAFQRQNKAEGKVSVVFGANNES